MTSTYLVGVRGESFANEDGTSRQDLIRKLRPGELVRLVADPTNPHDRWAVKVLTETGEQIGWLPSDARDADTLLKGEPIIAKIHAVHGGTNPLNVLLGKRSVGVVLQISKDEPDWNRRAEMERLAEPFDAAVEAALRLEEKGDDGGAVLAFRDAVSRIRTFTQANPEASAHRRQPAPVDRLSLILERKRDYANALEVIEVWEREFDPVQPTKAVCETLRKRAERLRKRMAGTK